LAVKHDGGAATAPPRFELAQYHGRPDTNPAVHPQSTDSCGHSRALVRHVSEIDGSVRYVCRECFAYLRKVETRAVVWREVSTRLRNCLPPGVIRGAFVRALAAIVTRSGEVEANI
jgi:hypothetical protein